MIDKVKLQEAFSDKEYVASIAKLSAEDAAKSLCQKGVEVTAGDLMKVHDFIITHKEKMQNGELDEDALAEIAGGMTQDEAGFATIFVGAGGLFLCIAALAFSW